MSALAWLFGLGAAAVVFPLVFHLIRRTPRGETVFSSLMFLRASPPTLTKRSRLDNLWLLLLRAAAICLLAFAFMRPFLRSQAELVNFDVENRRVAILLDTSASMQRTGVWQRARHQVREVLDRLESKDRVALLTFDRDVRTEVGFGAEDEATDWNVSQSVDSIQNALKELEPGSGHSDLGKALVTVANQLDDWQDAARSDRAGRRPKMQIMVISDLQEGSEVAALQSYQWPPAVKVQFLQVPPPGSSNATVEVLPAAEEQGDVVRIRVTNADDSPTESFTVQWDGVAGSPAADQSLEFFVPPGTNRTLTIPVEQLTGRSQVRLVGDAELFDNTYYLVPPEQKPVSVMFVGDDDPDDPESNLYYLQRALTDTVKRDYEVRQQKSNQDWPEPAEATTAPPDLVVVADVLSDASLKQLQLRLDDGAQALIVLSSPEQCAQLKPLIGVQTVLPPVPPASQRPDDYRMLSEINFGSDLFRPFASPSFSDFTKIRFWQHQRVKLLPEAQVLARFDNGDPACWLVPAGQSGQVFVLAAGWRPSDSQLALSSKFVPLISNLMELAADFPALDQTLTVGDWIDFPGSRQTRKMTRPGGNYATVEAGATRFRMSNQPGIYRLNSESPANEDSPAEMQFAVNVDRRESRTTLIPVEQLERLGVQVGQHETAASELEQLRELRDREIEHRQKIWKWMLVAAILVLVAESFYAGRKALTASPDPVFAQG